MLRRNGMDGREVQFSAPQIAQVAADNVARIACDRQLDQAIVCFVRQVWPPTEVDWRPPTRSQLDIQQFIAFVDTQFALAERRVTRKHVQVFAKQGVAHQWNVQAENAIPYDSARRLHAKTGTNENIGINNDEHFKMVA